MTEPSTTQVDWLKIRGRQPSPDTPPPVGVTAPSPPEPSQTKQYVLSELKKLLVPMDVYGKPEIRMPSRGTKRFEQEQRALWLLGGGVPSMVLYDEIEEHKQRIHVMLREKEEEAGLSTLEKIRHASGEARGFLTGGGMGFSEALKYAKETPMGGFLSGFASGLPTKWESGEKGEPSGFVSRDFPRSVPDLFAGGVMPSFGEGIFFRAEVAADTRERMKQREDVIARMLAQGEGRQIASMLGGILAPEFHAEDPLNALFFAVPPGAMVLGGASRLIRELSAIRKLSGTALRGGLRATPDPVLALGEKFFFAPKPSKVPILQTLKSAANTATKKLTDDITDVNNIGQRSRAEMKRIQAQQDAAIAGMEKDLAETRRAHTNLRRSKTKTPEALEELSKKRTDLANKLRETKAKRITDDAIELADVEVNANLLRAMSRVWTAEARETHVMRTKLARGAGNAEVGRENERFADLLEMIRRFREVATQYPRRSIGMGVGKGKVAVTALNKLELTISQRLGPTRFADAMAASRVFPDKYAQLLADDVAAGLVSPTLARELSRANPNYSPIKYAEALIDAYKGAGGNLKLSNITNPIKRLRAVVDEKAYVLRPSEVFNQTYMQRRRLQWDNTTARSFAKSLLYDPMYAGEIKRSKNMQLVARISKGIDEIEGQIIALRKRLESDKIAGVSTTKLEAKIGKLSQKAVDMALKGEDEILELVFRQSRIPKKGSLAYIENGKPVFYTVPEEVAALATAVRNTGRSPSILSWTGVVQNPAKSILTGANPAFYVPYLFLDSAIAMYVSNVAPQRIIRALIRNIFDVYKQGLLHLPMPKSIQVGLTDDAKTWWRSGGAAAGVTGTPTQYLERVALGKAEIIPITTKAWRNTVGKYLVEPLESMGAAFENAPRRAVFERDIERGESLKRAALEARRVTVDFDRGGSLMREANHLWLFLNAGVQGTMIPARAARTKNPKLLLKNTGIFLTTDLLIYLNNRTYAEYQDIPIEERYGFINIMLPFDKYDAKRGKRVPMRIGIPLRELSFIHGPLMRLFETLDNKDKPAFDEFAKAMLQYNNPFTSIVGTHGNLLQIPTMLGESLREVGENKNAFFDEPITPDEYKHLPKDQQFDVNTSEVARRLGSLGWPYNPFEWDFLLQRGIGRDLIVAADKILVLRDLPDIPGIDDPIIKRDIYAWAAQLENLVDLTPPDMIASERRRLLSNIPEKHRDVVQEIAAKPSKLPFISSVVNRMMRQHGGQQYRTSVERTQEELGLDAEQVRDASAMIEEFMGGHQERQEAIDDNVLRGLISRQQWLGQRSDISAYVNMQFLMVTDKYPDTPWALSNEDQEEYNTMVNTMLGTVPDRRDAGLIVLAGYKGIPLPEEAPGVPDFDEWNRAVTSYRASLSDEMNEILNTELRQKATPVERKWMNAQEILQPYWDITTRYIEQHPILEMLLDEIKVMESNQQFTDVKRLKERQEYKDFKKDTNADKQALRERFGTGVLLEATMRFWGLAEAVSPRAMRIAETMSLE